MKRLISMTGRAGRARLEITEAGGRYEASYEGAGELWLLSGEGRPHRGKSAEFMPMGAMVLNENGELLLHGGLCGKKGAFERARAEAMLMRPQIAQHSAALGEIRRNGNKWEKRRRMSENVGKCGKPVPRCIPVLPLEKNRLPRNRQLLPRGRGASLRNRLRHNRPAGGVPPREEAGGL